MIDLDSISDIWRAFCPSFFGLVCFEISQVGATVLATSAESSISTCFRTIMVPSFVSYCNRENKDKKRSFEESFCRRINLNAIHNSGPCSYYTIAAEAS